jgi:hypothetical protein
MVRMGGRAVVRRDGAVITLEMRAVGTARRHRPPPGRASLRAGNRRPTARAIFPSCLRLQTKLRFHTVAIGVKLLTRSWVDGGSLAQQGLHSIREFPFLTHE